MEHTPLSDSPSPDLALSVGMVATVRHDDESWTRYLLAIDQALDVLRIEHGSLPVISFRTHPLGRILLGKKIGYEACYVDGNGNKRRAWLEGIDLEPVRDGKGFSRTPPYERATMQGKPWQPKVSPPLR